MKRFSIGSMVAAVTVAAWLAVGVPFASAAAADAERVVVSIDPASPPFESEVDGKLVGFDIDLIKLIAAAADLPIVIRTTPWTGIIPGLQAGTVDASINGITITKERMQGVNFSNAYYRSGLSVLVKKGSDIKGFDDLKGRVIAVRKGTSAVDYLQHHDMFDPKLVKQYGAIDAAYQALVTGGADAVIYDDPMNIGFALTRDDVTTVGELLTGEYYGIALNRRKPELVDKFNQGLAKVQADGSYAELFDKFLGGDRHGYIEGTKTPDEVAVAD